MNSTTEKQKARKTKGRSKTAGGRSAAAAEKDRLHYIDHPSFSKAGTDTELWGDESGEIAVSAYGLLPEVTDGPTSRTPSRTALSAAQERTLFLRYNYAKYRLNKLARRRGSRSAKRREEAALWSGRARRAREKIVHANLPLVPAMAKRKAVEGVEFAERVSEGYMAVLRCVEHFDVSRGFKFSTYACRAILACFHRMGSKQQTYRKHIPVEFDPALERDDFTERRHEDQRSDAIESVRRVLKENLAELSEVEEEVVRQRFPVVSTEKPKPLSQIGKALGVSTERVRQIEKTSLGKLREVLATALPA